MTISCRILPNSVVIEFLIGRVSLADGRSQTKNVVFLRKSLNFSIDIWAKIFKIYVKHVCLRPEGGGEGGNGEYIE